MEIKREVDSNDITECSHDHLSSTGMLGFLMLCFLLSIFCIIVPSGCIFSFQKRSLSLIHI